VQRCSRGTGNVVPTINLAQVRAWFRFVFYVTLDAFRAGQAEPADTISLTNFFRQLNSTQLCSVRFYSVLFRFFSAMFCFQFSVFSFQFPVFCFWSGAWRIKRICLTTRTHTLPEMETFQKQLLEFQVKTFFLLLCLVLFLVSSSFFFFFWPREVVTFGRNMQAHIEIQIHIFGTVFLSNCASRQLEQTVCRFKCQRAHWRQNPRRNGVATS